MSTDQRFRQQSAERTQSTCLVLRGYGVAYDDQVVLSDVDLEVPERGILVIVGPTATGKSTLLRTLAGFNGQIPSLHTWGESKYLGRPLDDANRPVLVSQNSRLLTSTLLDNLVYSAPERFAATPKQKRARALENLAQVGLEEYVDDLGCKVVELPLAVQRLVAIARVLPSEPRLLLIDEPTTGLNDADAERILLAVKEQGDRRAVVIVLHNQKHARFLGGRTALLAGGIVQEVQQTDSFFDAPITSAGREFRQTGTCSEPSPAAKFEDLNTGTRPRLNPPPRGIEIRSEMLGPRGFVWLLPGKLAGTPRPGVVADIEYDLAALKRVEVTTLLSLTMRPLDHRLLDEYGLTAHWYPIEDMGAPSFEMASDICTLIDDLLARGETIAVHCRAGLGRTGTILTAYLIWRGDSAISALETARRIEPKWVQSQAQVQFLESFAFNLANAKTGETLRQRHTA